MIDCDLVIGYSPSQGVIWPDLNRWKAVQKLLGLLPHEGGWEAEPRDVPPIGEFRPDGTFVANQLGVARLRATVGEISVESAPIEIVTSRQIERLEISPREVEIVSGNKQQFSLTAYQRSDAVRVQQAEWRVIGDIGTVTPTGVFSATKEGRDKLHATVGEITTESGEITVVPGGLAKLEIEFPENQIFPGQPYTPQILGEDASGNIVKIQEAKWEAITADAGEPA